MEAESAAVRAISNSLFFMIAPDPYIPENPASR
jgi:hypothetical protein